MWCFTLKTNNEHAGCLLDLISLLLTKQFVPNNLLKPKHLMIN